MPGEPARKVRVEQGKVEQARFTLARDVNSCFLPQRTQRCAEVFAQIRALRLIVLVFFVAWCEKPSSPSSRSPRIRAKHGRRLGRPRAKCLHAQASAQDHFLEYAALSPASIG